MSPFYRSEAGLLHPQGPAAVPGRGEQQNSGAVGALMAREIERVPALAPLWLARLTVEAPRVVPMAPVAMRTRILRNGKRLQLVKAELTVDGETYASALGLRVCLGVCPHDAPVARPMPGHGASTDSPNAFSGSSPLQGWMVEDEAARIGSFAYWASCDADLVQGEAATSVVRAVMACDLVAAVSRNAQGGAAYPGIDLSLYLARVPSGDWILAENDAEPADAGRCLVSSLLSDGDGAFGYAHQTLVYSNAAD